MKIVHYAYDDVNNPWCGGGGAYRELMIHRILSVRHTIRFYTGNFSGARNSKENGISFTHLGFKKNYLLSRISFSIIATVHSLFVRADCIVIAYSVFSPVMTFLFRRRKTILEFYHLTNMEPFKKYSLFGIFPWMAERIALIFCRNFLTLTNSMAAYIQQKHPGTHAVSSYTGYDEEVAKRRRAPVIQGKYILYFGRIDIHMKGIDILIDAFEHMATTFPQLSLVLAGRGSVTDINWVEKRIRESVFQKQVIFMQNVPNEQKYSLFQHAVFVCMPSRFEGWCISAIEAAACGKATVGTDIMGLRDSIRNTKTGILVLSEHVEELADAMRRLLTDECLRNELGSNGIEWSKNFTWEKVSQLQENFYATIKK